MSLLQQIFGLIGWLLLCFAVAAGGGLASANAGGFFDQLARPAWAPPAWLFGPVWTVLYAMMAVAAWLVWRAGGFAATTTGLATSTKRSTRAALTLFLVQLLLNGLWTWIFFAWRLGGLALAEILLLWALILATIAAFARVRPPAAWLMVPYLAWVTYASALTYALWRLNPGLLR